MKIRGGFRFALSLLLLSLLLSWPLFAAAADPGVDVSGLPDNGLALSPYLAVLEDPGQQLGLAEVRQPAVAERFVTDAAPSEALSYGYTGSAYWLRLTLNNPGSTAQQTMLELSNARLSDVRLFRAGADGQFQSILTGSALPFASRPLRNRYFVFPLTVAPHGSEVLYLRVASAGAKLIPLRLWTADDFAVYQSNDYLIQGGYFGMTLAMLLFNVILYVALRDRIYLQYVGFVACAAFALAAQNGLAKQLLWPEAGAWSNVSASVGFSLAAALFVIFMRSMLKTAVAIPRLDRVLQALLAIFLLTPLGAMLSYQTIAKPVTMLWSLASPLILLLCLYLAYLGQRSAGYFSLAFLVFFVGNASSSLEALGLLPHNLLTNYGSQLGSACEMMLLALALAERFKLIRRERALARRQALEAQQSLLESLKHSERRLEQRVAERTDELRLVNARLEAMSATDGLTGIANRRRFDEALQAEWTRAMRLGQPLALAMLDVDYFKRFNDLYGHQAGDDCLRRVASSIAGLALRGGDLVARYGGEEFVLIAPMSDGASARLMADKVCAAVAALGVPHQGSHVGSVTVSIGVAALVPQPGQGQELLLRAADLALYQAKAQGRNRVVLAAAPGEAGPAPEQRLAG